MKHLTDIQGLNNVRTLSSTGKRSISRTQSSTFLDLYMLKRWKDVLENEMNILEKKRKSIKKKLKDINENMDKLQEMESEKRKNPRAFKKPLQGELKKMSLKY